MTVAVSLAFTLFVTDNVVNAYKVSLKPGNGGTTKPLGFSDRLREAEYRMERAAVDIVRRYNRRSVAKNGVACSEIGFPGDLAQGMAKNVDNKGLTNSATSVSVEVKRWESVGHRQRLGNERGKRQVVSLHQSGPVDVNNDGSPNESEST